MFDSKKIFVCSNVFMVTQIQASGIITNVGYTKPCLHHLHSCTLGPLATFRLLHVLELTPNGKKQRFVKVFKSFDILNQLFNSFAHVI